MQYLDPNHCYGNDGVEQGHEDNLGAQFIINY
jgi:hypothetical protein